MATNKHDAVMAWLRTCPHIADLFFAFSHSDDGDTQLIPAESVIAEYIDGSTLRRYDCALTRFAACSFEPNDGANIEELMDFDRISEWIEAQYEAGNLPEFPAGETVQEISVLPNASGYFVAQDEDSAKLMIQFQIDYLKEATRHG